MAERVGFGLSPRCETSQLIDFTLRQNARKRYKSLIEVQSGYTKALFTDPNVNGVLISGS
jgi:hypothetical protein